MPQMTVTVSIHGPIFAGMAPAAINDALNEAVKDLVAEGEREVKLQLYPGHGLVTGHYRSSIHGELAGNLHGVIDDSKVVYGAWLEGVSSRNQTTRFKGYAMFRNARQKLQGIAQRTVEAAVRRIIQRLG